MHGLGVIHAMNAAAVQRARMEEKVEVTLKFPRKTLEDIAVTIEGGTAAIKAAMRKYPNPDASVCLGLLAEIRRQVEALADDE